MAGSDDSNKRIPPGAERPRRLARRAWCRLAGEPEGAAQPPHRVTLVTIAGIVALLIVWRGAIFVASFAWGRLGIDRPWPGEEHRNLLWRYLVRWDSNWYLDIAEQGYMYDPGQQSHIAFFPLLPYSTRFADWVLPGEVIFAGMVVVHLALLGAMVYVYQLARLDYPPEVAWRSLLFLLAFPTAIFFAAIYTESLLVLGMAGTLYHARRGQWLLAGTFGLVTGLTKLIGLILVIPMALELIRQEALSLRAPRGLLALAMVPAGALGYLGYLHVWLGDFRAYFWTQEHWGRSSFDPEVFFMFARFLRGEDPGHLPYPGETFAIHNGIFMLDTISLMFFLGAGIYLWARVRPSYGALVIAGALVPALSGTPLSLARFMVILFPVFILLGRIRSEPVRNAVAIAFLAGLGFQTFLLVNGYWAG